MGFHRVADGTRIAYTLSGSGPPVVLLHGWMCNRGFWREQISFLSATHRVLAPDFRGHGDSDVAEGGYTMEGLAEDVHEVMTALGMSPAVVVGHSMGGMVAQQFYLSHREDVSALVLVTTIAADPEDHLISKRIEAETSQMGFETTFLRYFDGWFSPQADPSLVSWVRSEMLRPPERVGLALVRSYRNFDVREHLPDFRVPTLVIGAGADASAIPAESRVLAERIPGAQLVIFEGVGHFVAQETPQAVNRALEEFLSAHGL